MRPPKKNPPKINFINNKPQRSTFRGGTRAPGFVRAGSASIAVGCPALRRKREGPRGTRGGLARGWKLDFVPTRLRCWHASKIGAGAKLMPHLALTLRLPADPMPSARFDGGGIIPVLMADIVCSRLRWSECFGVPVCQRRQHQQRGPCVPPSGCRPPLPDKASDGSSACPSSREGVSGGVSGALGAQVSSRPNKTFQKKFNGKAGMVDIASHQGGEGADLESDTPVCQCQYTGPRCVKRTGEGECLLCGKMSRVRRVE